MPTARFGGRQSVPKGRGYRTIPPGPYPVEPYPLGQYPLEGTKYQAGSDIIPLPLMNRMTYTWRNITFPQLRLRAVITHVRHTSG